MRETIRKIVPFCFGFLVPAVCIGWIALSLALHWPYWINFTGQIALFGVVVYGLIFFPKHWSRHLHRIKNIKE